RSTHRRNQLVCLWSLEVVSRIPLNTRGKRPNFFEHSGLDQTVSMVLELMAELWVVKERQFRIERLLEKHSIDVSNELEALELDEDTTQELEQKRRQFVETVLRTLDNEFVSPDQLQQEVDQLSDSK
ncbi:MAG: hypothetical protein AAF438_22740, partial [Pseudomonadota bacterium]